MILKYFFNFLKIFNICFIKKKFFHFNSNLIEVVIFSEPKIRGLMLSITTLSNNTGVCLMYVLGAFFTLPTAQMFGVVCTLITLMSLVFVNKKSYKFKREYLNVMFLIRT